MGSWVAFGWSHCGIREMEGSGKEELRRADGTQEQEVRVPVLLEQSAPAAPVSASEAVVEEGEAKEQAQERSGSASFWPRLIKVPPARDLLCTILPPRLWRRIS